MAPDPDAWLLLFPLSDGNREGTSFLITEPGRKGRILSEEECRKAFPEVRLPPACGLQLSLRPSGLLSHCWLTPAVALSLALPLARALVPPPKMACKSCRVTHQFPFRSLPPSRAPQALPFQLCFHPMLIFRRRRCPGELPLRRRHS